MVGSELAIMPVFPSDTDPEMEDELSRLQPLPTPVSPMSAPASLRVVESPSDYPAPAVPVGCLSCMGVSWSRQGGELCGDI